MTEIENTPETAALDLNHLQGLIRAGELSKAEDVFAQADPESTETLPAHMAKTRLRLAQGDVSAAALIVEQNLAAHADKNPWAWSLCVHALSANGQDEPAQELFLSGLQAAHDHDEQVAQAGIDAILDHTQGHDAKVALLSAALANVPASRPVQLKLASRHMLGGQPTKALELLTAAEAAGPLPAHAERVKTLLYPFIEGYSAAFDRLKSEAREAAPDSVRLRRMARFATAAHRYDEAYAELVEALKAFPDDWLVLYRLVRSKLSPDQRNSILADLYHYRTTKESNAAWHLQLGVLALQAGDVDKATAILSDVDDKSAISWSAHALLDAMAALDGAGPANTALQANREVEKVTKPDAVGTIIVFTTNTSGLELLPLQYVDSLLSKLPVNVIYLRDFSGLMYQKGLSECGDGVDAFHDYLKSLCEELGKPVLTLGNSFGANAAMRAALAIGEARVLSFAGIVDPGDGVNDDNPLVSQGAWELQNAGPLIDLSPILRERPDVQITHVFGADFQPDIQRAKGIDTLENIKVVPIADVGHHYVGLECVARKLFIQLIEESFQVGKLI